MSLKPTIIDFAILPERLGHYSTSSLWNPIVLIHPKERYEEIKNITRLLVKCT